MASSWTSIYRSVLGGGVEKGLTEALPILVVGGGLNNNLLVVIRELVDDVLVLLAELQVIVGSYALLRNGGSEKVRRVSCVVRRRSRPPLRSTPSRCAPRGCAHRGSWDRKGRVDCRYIMGGGEEIRVGGRTQIETGNLFVRLGTSGG